MLQRPRGQQQSASENARFFRKSNSSQKQSYTGTAAAPPTTGGMCLAPTTSPRNNNGDRYALTLPGCPCKGLSGAEARGAMSNDFRAQASLSMCVHARLCICYNEISVISSPRLQDSRRDARIQPLTPRIAVCTGCGRLVGPLFCLKSSSVAVGRFVLLLGCRSDPAQKTRSPDVQCCVWDVMKFLM